MLYKNQDVFVYDCTCMYVCVCVCVCVCVHLSNTHICYPSSSQIVVVPDVLDSIAEEVKRFTPAYDFVLTTGGIGPTHDDVTLAGGTNAWGVLVHNRN